MYYPYLRGRQNELLCLKELLDEDKLSVKITPILEPVKFSSTFLTTLKRFIENDREILLIKNPQVGRFDEGYAEALRKANEEEQEDTRIKLRRTLEEYENILLDGHIRKAYLMNDESVKKVLQMPEQEKKQIYVLNQNRGDDNYYIQYGDKLSVRASFIPKDEDFKDEVPGDAVILEDCYQKARRNVDYMEQPDVSFSKNHLIFEKRGYKGFSDYSVIGKEYEESGFAPFAVAIHVVYFNERQELRVHHFVSDSNWDYSDPARKFGEAMEKLVNWERIDLVKYTRGLSGLLQYYEAGRFPGLGLIKKLSLMHHIELMGRFLEGRE